MMRARSLIPIVPILGLLVLCAGARASDNPGKVPITTASREAMSLFLEGRTLMENLRLTDAFSRFRQSAEKDPSFAMAYLYMGQTAPTAKEFFSAIDKSADLAKHASAAERLWITGFRAGAYGDPAAQRTSYRKLVDMFPDDERAQTLLGTHHLAQQDYAQAVRSLKRATEINPKFAPAYNQLGYAYRFLERFDQAEETFKTYIQLIPGDPNPYDSYAELLLKLGRFDEAIEQYRRALSINKEFANSYTGIGAALMYEGKHEEARKEFGQAFANARTDGEKRAAIFGNVVAYVDEGNLDMALQEMRREYAIAEQTNDVANMAADQTAMGNILLEAGRADEAQKAFENAATLMRSSRLASEVKENAELFYHYNLGRVALLRKDYATATKGAERFRTGAEMKNNRNLIRLAHELHGTIALEQEEYVQAVRELRQANQQNPYNLYRLALAYEGTHVKDEARKYCQAAARFHGLPQLNYAFIRRKADSHLSTI